MTDTTITVLHRSSEASLRLMRWSYILLAVFFSVFLLGYSWFTWKAVMQDQSDELASIAELGGNSIDGYFYQYQIALHTLAEDIAEQKGKLDPVRTRKLLMQFLRNYPDIQITNVNRPDGQILVSTENVPTEDLPNQGSAPSFVAGRELLEKGLDFDIGRATWGPLAKGWVLPLRQAIRDENGKLKFVLVAVLPLSRQQSFWHDMPLPPKTALGLLRDDAYLVSRFPSGLMDPKEAYGMPRTGVLVEFLRENAYPPRGVLNGYNSVAKQENLFGFRRLDHFQLTLFVTTPITNVYQRWWRQVQYVYLLMLALLAIGVLVYRRNWQKQSLLEGERGQYESKLRESEERFRRVAFEAPMPMMIHAENGEVLELNRAWMATTGYTRADLPDITSWIKRAYEENTQFVQDAKSIKELIERVYGIGHRIDQGERTIRCKDGSTRIWHFSAAPVGTLPDGRRYVVSMAQDITERKAAQEQIEFMAYHDALTGLPNRMLVKNLLEQAILEAERDQRKVALLFVDLDKFKTINDSLGHLVGDALLRAVAGRIRSCLREVDALSRQGGDEFLIVLKDVKDSDAITVVTDKLLAKLAEPVRISQHDLSISLSIGVAVYPDDGKDFDTLLKKADTAMYQAKESGRNTCRFHTEQMNIDATEHLRLRNGLRRALEQGEFQLYYQPQIHVASGEVIGAEALLRWQHPELGMVAPGRFISIAEDSGLIVPISEWVIREACHQAMAWRKAGLHSILMAVNLSAVHFKRGNLVESVLLALQESGLDPSFLELELTESILIKDTEMVLGVVRQLKSIGLKLSIDDFGTGYSSLSYLKQFNVDKLKIDQSFVRDMADDPNDAAIVRAIIQMAKSLNLVTIAEGVEDERQLALLKLQQCDEVQGYYFAKPMPADAFAAYLHASYAIKSAD